MSHIININIILNITTHSLRPFSSSFSHVSFFLFFSPIFLIHFSPLFPNPSSSHLLSPFFSFLFYLLLLLHSFDLSHRACQSSSRYTASSLLGLLSILTYRLVMRLFSVRYCVGVVCRMRM